MKRIIALIGVILVIITVFVVPASAMDTCRKCGGINLDGNWCNDCAEYTALYCCTSCGQMIERVSCSICENYIDIGSTCDICFNVDNTQYCVCGGLLNTPSSSGSNVTDKTYTQAELDALIAEAEQNAYNTGYSNGYSQGMAAVDRDYYYQIGYNEGYTAGENSVNTQYYWDSGYNAGVVEGKSQGFDEGVASVDTDKYYNNGYDQGYSVGYDAGVAYSDPLYHWSQGFEQGIIEGRYGYTENSEVTAQVNDAYRNGVKQGESNDVSDSFIDLVGEIAFAPYRAVSAMFDFEIFGINIAGLCFELLTIIIVLIVGKFVLSYIFG